MKSQQDIPVPPKENSYRSNIHSHVLTFPNTKKYIMNFCWLNSPGTCNIWSWSEQSWGVNPPLAGGWQEPNGLGHECCLPGS